MPDQMLKFSFASGANAQYLDDQYAAFKADPNAVDPSWKTFFEGYEFALQAGGGGGSHNEGHSHAKVEAFINAYRRVGHLSAHLDPLSEKPAIAANMLPAAHGLGDVPAGEKFRPANIPIKDEMSFADIVAFLNETYCGHIGADFREMNEIETVTWFQTQMESVRNRPQWPTDVKKRILERLMAAEGFERFLQARYLGQKRFSLEGAEALVPMIDAMMFFAGDEHVFEMCLGMAHRGRLNVLANILQKSPDLMLKEFEGSEAKPFDIDGDVKYHMGFANVVKTFGGHDMTLYLSPNPSHLEAANPVVEGFARARQRLLAQGDATKIMPILLHGDAAFIGQGIVAETLNLSQLEAYKTGGTIHIIINNQIGFTTSPHESRSCTYSSEIAKMVRAPVLHVNADDPESVIWTAKLAIAYRQRFHRDIVIDLIGYRRHGHNETDEPSYTQPLMYKKIEAHPTVYQIYRKQLVDAGVLSDDEATKQEADYRARWQASFELVKSGKYAPGPVNIPQSLQRALNYKKATDEDLEKPAATMISDKLVKSYAEKIASVKSGFKVHPKLVKLLETRKQMVDGEGNIDWAMGELLAFAALAAEGHHVRLSGQDCRRGTFSSRQGVLFDYDNGSVFEPLKAISKDQAPVDIINSPLSEVGVMGFEFGYSVADPDALVLWEAQFGDFANGAQIIIDQFLVASEAKWKQTCGLVLLLPHGYEGQGPEHSNARPERFLQLCGNANIQVAIPTTPAQYFHILRRQLHRPFRKPLVLMTPKSLLRHPKVVSKVKDFTDRGFAEIIPDARAEKSVGSVERVVFCTGKIFYELDDMREKKNIDNIAIVRVEQLHPFPEKQIKKVLDTFSHVKDFVWVQEEPQNMGAWTYIRPKLMDLVDSIRYAGRMASGTTAEGSLKAHQKEQARILEDAIGAPIEAKKKASGMVK